MKVNNMAPAITASDKKWEAEQDARTLMESQVISNDKRRMNAAIKAAKRMAKEKAAESKAMNGVAKKKTKRG